MYDYNKLKGKITEKGLTRAEFAKAVGISEASLSLRMNNRREWTQDEMIEVAKILDFDVTELKDYFFTHAV